MCDVCLTQIHKSPQLTCSPTRTAHSCVCTKHTPTCFWLRVARTGSVCAQKISTREHRTPNTENLHFHFIYGLLFREGLKKNLSIKKLQSCTQRVSIHIIWFSTLHDCGPHHVFCRRPSSYLRLVSGRDPRDERDET
jgi:hypothetical protein